MHAVHQEMKALSPDACRLVMENTPMHVLFDEGPDEEAKDKQTRDHPKRQRPLDDRNAEACSQSQEVDDQRRYRVNMREKFHEIALEHAHGFVFVGDVSRHKLRR